MGDKEELWRKKKIYIYISQKQPTRRKENKKVTYNLVKHDFIDLIGR
jgi:hypothetical protein